jgi:hypothetical protein
MELTPEEEKVILKFREDKKKQEELKSKANIPQKIGYLKCSIYKNDGDIITQNERDEMLNDYMNQFKLIAEADTKMICYYDKHGEKWHIDNGSKPDNKNQIFGEYMAKQSLRDIEEIK